MTELTDLLAACNALATDAKYAAKTRALATALDKWAPTVTPPSAYLFHDDFDGPAGAPPDPAKWVNRDSIAVIDGSSAKAANAFLDGDGHLVLRVTREPFAGRTTAGGVVGTYQYQTGWPPKPILASWPVPFRYEVSYQTPIVPGFWDNPGWLQNVDRPNGYVEIDAGETRTTFPTQFGAALHTWTKQADGTYVDSPKFGQYATGAAGTWHTFACEARSSGTTFSLDGKLIGTGFAVSGSFGVILHNCLADVSAWGSGGQQPPPADPGPWDMRIDYVRVTAL